VRPISGARDGKAFYLFLAVGLVVLTAVLMMGAGTKPTPVPPDGNIHSKITNIIYPTLGYPQLVTAGGEFTLEFDFTADDLAAAQPESVDGWRVEIASSNGYVPYEADLEVTGVELGTSRRWPEGSGREVYEVYRVTAGVPSNIPPDLYDIEVWVTADGKEVVDSQPNSVSVKGGFREDYRVIQVSDIHVFDINFPFSCNRDRELCDAVYLRKVVEQINLIHPDFVVFTGDLIFGQRYLPEDWPPDNMHSGETEYEYEDLWAYQALSQLDVPCYMVMGNHDGYNDTDRDGCDWWTDSFGPLYYSFDYGDDHYTMIDTMDWSREDRTLEKPFYYGVMSVLQPRKWQGQVRSGGDKFGDISAPSPETYGGQLAWIRDDLAANLDAGTRVTCCHHDPAQIKCWEDADYIGYMIGGKGEGRLALQRLFADYHVSLTLSGHEHHDLITRMPWSGGQGSTIYANTTCIEPMGGTRVEYSGYRMVEVSNDQIAAYNYQEPLWSYPCYKGIIAGWENDLDPLFDPAISISFSNGGDWSGGVVDVTCSLNNSLSKDFQGARLEFYMPSLDNRSAYQATGTGNFDAVQVPVPGDPDRVIVYVYLDLPALSGKEIRISPG
jgi:3',5'-cyclic AMP phosphodiesterase CpdA